MPNRENWERGRIRNFERDWDPDDRFDEGYSEPYRSQIAEENRERWGASGRYGRKGQQNQGWGRAGWERDEESREYRGPRDFGPGRSMSERREGVYDRDWERYPEEGFGRYGASSRERYIGGTLSGYRPGIAREGWGTEEPGGYGRQELLRPDRAFQRGSSDWRRGPHAGRGPKGWKRSDERIREEVNEALARDPDLDATSIEVTVANAEVTIRGVVENRHDKRLAEDIAEEIFGVEDVHNELKVRKGAFASLTGEKAEPEDEMAARQSATTTTAATATKNSVRSR
jgi:hypothetical protein